MHAPNAATHGNGTTREPDEFCKTPGTVELPGEIERSIGGANCDENRQRYKTVIVKTTQACVSGHDLFPIKLNLVLSFGAQNGKNVRSFVAVIVTPLFIRVGSEASGTLSAVFAMNGYLTLADREDWMVVCILVLFRFRQRQLRGTDRMRGARLLKKIVSEISFYDALGVIHAKFRSIE